MNNLKNYGRLMSVMEVAGVALGVGIAFALALLPILVLVALMSKVM